MLIYFIHQENRLRLKLVLLRVFGAMCSLDSGVISLLLFSVLTTELADELQQNIEGMANMSAELIFMFICCKDVSRTYVYLLQVCLQNLY
jgi:hypothetical protein